jgi:hypothetical protein
MMKGCLVVGVLLILAACAPVASSPAETATFHATSIPSATSTASFFAPVFRLTGTATPLATQTRTPGLAPTITFLPGLTPLQHPGFPGLVFLVDTRRWANDFHPGDPTADQERFLHYNTIPACRLEANSPSPLPMPAQIDTESMRGRVFHIYKYTGYEIYQTGQVYFKLEDTNNLECHTVLGTLLANMVDSGEFYGGATGTPFATREPVTQTGFSCNTLPARLRPGDSAYINNRGVWLRSSPEVGPNNMLKLFPKHAPVLVSILDGPQCASGYLYWQVSITEIGAEQKIFTGWMAEANAAEYLLLNWNP